jgi:hypothetical protein
MYERPDMGKFGKVNVYGVVVGFQAPRITKRGDWMITASLIDKSLPLPGQEGAGLPVTLVVFCKQQTQLPQLVRMGDVLRMHRVSLQVRSSGMNDTGVALAIGCFSNTRTLWMDRNGKETFSWLEIH